jgi:hypothetical protein
MPIRAICSKSAVMPSLLTFPLSHHQYTQGLPESGGMTKFFSNSTGSAAFTIGLIWAQNAASITKT